MLVLLVDSDMRRATAVAEYLTEHGHEVDFACDVDTGSALAHAHRFDACLIADSMRNARATDLCRALRREGVGYPIAILASDAGLESVLAGFDAGADDVFRAPADMREVLAKVVNLVHPIKTQMRSELHVGNLRLDLLTRTLRGRSAVSVSGMACRLLALLMQNAPRVLPSASIAERLWPTGTAHPHVIRVHVNAARKALRSCGATVAIRSHVGVGYSISARSQRDR